MKCTVNDIDIEIKCGFVRINQKPTHKDRSYDYNCKLKIYSKKELNEYEKEKIENWIRQEIDKD